MSGKELYELISGAMAVQVTGGRLNLGCRHITTTDMLKWIDDTEEQVVMLLGRAAQFDQAAFSNAEIQANNILLKDTKGDEHRIALLMVMGLDNTNGGG